MYTWAFAIIGVGIALWFLSKKHASLFVTGVGVGLLWGALWAASLIRAAFN